MVFLIATIAVILIGCGSDASDGSTNGISNNKISIEKILDEYNECREFAESNKDCKFFTARAICEYNGIDDFRINGTYIDYHDIYETIQNNGKWSLLGWATDPEVLEKAQAVANSKQPIVAIKTDDKHLFTVLIVEGEAVKSTKWGGKAPICAAFFPVSSKMEPFIDQSLNYVWSKPEGVAFYVRN